MNKYVQHKSGQGEKWQVDSYYDDHEMFWRVPMKPGVADLVYRLPKSEYIECDPPEQWEECTREVVEPSKDYDNRKLEIKKANFLTVGAATMGSVTPNYCWAWRGDALVIERRTS